MLSKMYLILRSAQRACPGLELGARLEGRTSVMQPRKSTRPYAQMLADPVKILAHVMVSGTVEDLKALRGIVGKDDYREVLEHAPTGVFDVRSWAYWNLVCGRQPTPPLPMRTLPSTHPMPR